MRTPIPLLALVAVTSAALLAQAPAKAIVPLRPGLTIVTAVAENFGDYESIKRITAVGDKGYTLSYSADVPEDPDEDLGPGEKPKMREVRGRRTVLAADLQGAHEYMQLFGDKQPEVYKGATAIGVSSAILSELKTKGQAEIKVVAGGIEGMLGALMGGMLGGDALTEPARWKGTISIVKGAPATLTVLVNGTPTPLPVVHAKGDLSDNECDFFFLDDPSHPLTLKFTIGDADLQVVRIEFPQEAPATAGTPPAGAGAGKAGAGAGAGNGAGGAAGGGGGAGTGEAATTSAASIEKALQTAGKIDIYGIYFDFDSDHIKPESEPVLREIAKVMTDNPTWTLSVAGHTDNIGGDTYNLDLSKRRAAAVKQALVTRYKVAGARLETSGYGASSPKATNKTLEGRAQNRRVELVKR